MRLIRMGILMSVLRWLDSCAQSTNEFYVNDAGFYGGFDSEINNMEKTAARRIKVEKLPLKEYLIKKIFQAQILKLRRNKYWHAQTKILIHYLSTVFIFKVDLWLRTHLSCGFDLFIGFSLLSF